MKLFELSGVFPVTTMPLTRSIVEIWEGVEIPMKNINKDMFPECIEFFKAPEKLFIPNYIYLKHLYNLKQLEENLNFEFMKFIPFEEKIEGVLKYFMMVVIMDKPYPDQKSRDDAKVAAGSLRYIYELTIDEVKRLVICRDYVSACAVLKKIINWGSDMSNFAGAVKTSSATSGIIV